MSQLSPERRKVAVLGGSIAAMSAGVGAMLKNHPHLAIAWLVLLFVALMYVVMQLVKIKRSEKP